MIQRIRTIVTVAGIVLAANARADESQGPVRSDTCSVVRKCSSTGLACNVGDRACTEGARSRGLEVLCEAPEDRLVFCPPNTRGGDSRVVWVLLAAASAFAIVGAAIAWFVLRTKKPEV
jgi:hypothetical protein